jgi:hypothetical protein
LVLARWHDQNSQDAMVINDCELNQTGVCL